MPTLCYAALSINGKSYSDGKKESERLPQELLDLFDRYVHGETSRRQFLEGAAKYAVGGLTSWQFGKA
jgi:hypothetical protein